jgi:hypothetical protein
LKKEFDELNISNFKNAYLPHQETNEYIILREKLKSIDIGTYSISGEKNLIYLVESEGKKYYMNQVMAIFTGLYSLSVFSRYHPNIWYPFVQKDETGERGLIESFLSIAYRKLPNLALNIVLDREIVFVNNSLGSIDTSQQYNTEDIKKLIHEETNK